MANEAEKVKETLAGIKLDNNCVCYVVIMQPFEQMDAFSKIQKKRRRKNTIQKKKKKKKIIHNKCIK